jgi:hypothetical protein
MDVNKRLRDLMNNEDDMDDMLDMVSPLEQTTTTPAPASGGTWSNLLKKLDANGPPLKKGKTKVEKPAKPPPYSYYEIPAGYFDPYKHGYCFVRSELMYRTPDDQLLKATGVDEFGPFKSAPVRRN